MHFIPSWSIPREVLASFIAIAWLLHFFFSNDLKQHLFYSQIYNLGRAQREQHVSTLLGVSCGGSKAGQEII